jgi:hypothetical protein
MPMKTTQQTVKQIHKKKSHHGRDIHSLIRDVHPEDVIFHFVSSDNDEITYKRECEEFGGVIQTADVRAGVAVYISYLAPVAFLHFREISRDEEGETIPFIDHPTNWNLIMNWAWPELKIFWSTAHQG